MRKLLYLLGGVAFGVAVARLLRRQPAGGGMKRVVAEPAAAGTPAAEALRLQLAASREGAARPPAESAAAEDDRSAHDVEGARRRVHGRGREQVDEMRRSGEPG